MSEDPQAAAALAASLDLRNSSLELAAWARWYVSPKTGARIARDAAWLKMVPTAIADGFTGGRSGIDLADQILIQNRHDRIVAGGLFINH